MRRSQGLGRVLRALRQPLATAAAVAALGALGSPDGARAQLSGRVVGGHDAPAGAYLFQAYLLTNGGRYACAATLIRPDWILTAAHCTQDPISHERFAPDQFEVRLGSRTKSSGGETHHVRAVFVHEGYSKPHVYENDIALLQLDRPSDLPTVRLEGQGAGQERSRVAPQASPWVRVVGWGYVDSHTRTTSDILQEAQMPLVPAEVCNQTLPPELADAGPIDDRRLCAGQNEGGVDSCNGDSGGPLLAKDEVGRDLQIGIVSYGVADCGRPKAYGVYTRVAAFAPWLEAHIGGAKGLPQPAASPGVSAPPPPPAPVEPLLLGALAHAPMLTAPPDAGGPELAVALDPDGNLKLGQTFKVRITSPVDGYLALFDLKADNTVVQIFPNARSEALGRSGRIRARAPTTLPDESYGFEMIADRPTGRGRIIALVAADRARLQAALKPGDGLKPLSDGPRTFETLQTALGPKRANGAGGLAWVSQFLDYYVSER